MVMNSGAVARSEEDGKQTVIVVPMEEMRKFSLEIRRSVESWRDEKTRTLTTASEISELSEVAEVVLTHFDNSLSSDSREIAWPSFSTSYSRADMARDCLFQAHISHVDIGLREFIEPFCNTPTGKLGRNNPEEHQCGQRLAAHTAIGRFLLDFSREIFRQKKTIRPN